jgi:hypothetical protein
MTHGPGTDIRKRDPSCSRWIPKPTPETAPNFVHLDFFKNAAEWKCTCCQAPADPCSHDWRWAGYTWQHYHGYPSGHFNAERIQDPEKGKAK